MVHDYELGGEFFAALTAWDAKIAERVAAAGCPRCGGPLHQGNYLRKPRGGLLAEAGEGSTVRHSLCCGRRGCRNRHRHHRRRYHRRRHRAARRGRSRKSMQWGSRRDWLDTSRRKR